MDSASDKAAILLPRRTRWGMTALIAVILYYVPIHLILWLPRFGVPVSPPVCQNVSNLIFDFGVWIDLLLIVMCVSGFRDPRERRASSIAAALLAASIVALYF